MKQPLTKTQKETLEYISKYKNENGYAPSIPEMKDRFGIALSSAWERLKHLENKEWIEREKHQSRWIKIL